MALVHASSLSEHIPVNLSRLSVIPQLAEILHSSTLRPGSVIGIAPGSGSTSLLMHLLAGPTQHGAWATVIGAPHLNPYAAVSAGVAIDRVAFIPEPGERWLEVVATAIDAIDIVVLYLHHPCRPHDARRLLARARQRHNLLVVAEAGSQPRLHSESQLANSYGRDGCGERRASLPTRPARRLWPETPDITLTTCTTAWNGIGFGHGCLQRTTIQVQVKNRRIGGDVRSGTINCGRPESP